MKPPDVAGLDVLNELPRTGIWEAWRARQTSLNRVVVLKILPPPIASGLADDRAFMADAGRVASVTHSNFVQIYDFRKTGSEYRLVTEYVQGQNLRDWIDKSRILPVPTALTIAGSIARVMKFAWEKLATVHGALKPYNVLLDSDGVIKVSDLGLSRHFQGLASVRAAAPPGVQAVTANYLSPEQCRLDGILDCRTDIYSLGAILYEMITGSMPFGSMPAEEVLRRQIEGQIPNPKELNHEVPIEVSFLVEKLMTKDRDRRARDWDEVCQDIERVKTGDLPGPELPASGASTVAFEVRAKPKPAPVVASDEPPQPISSKLSPLPVRAPDWQDWLKKPAVWAAAAAGLAALLLLWGLLSGTSRSAQKPPPRAEPVRTAPTPAPKKTPPRPPAKASSAPRRAPDRSAASQATSSPADDPDAGAVSTEAGEALGRAVQLLGEAKAWAESNPDCYGEAIGLFEAAANAAPGTPPALESLAHIERLRAGRLKGAQDTMRRLKAGAVDLLAKNKPQEALDLYVKYRGPLATETETERAAEAATLRRELAAHQARNHQAEGKFRAAVSNAAACLLKGAVPEAVQAADAAARDPDLAPRRAELEAMRNALADYTSLDQCIMDSFRELKGQEISVATVRGVEKVFVVGVQGDVLNAEKRSLVGEGEIRAPRVIRFADLTPAEKKQRLPRGESPSLVLAYGIAALQAGDWAAAQEYLAKAGPLLGPPLLERVAAGQAQQTEDAARQVLGRILKAARAPLPETEGGVPPCVEALGRGVYTPKEAEDFKAASEEFRRRYGQTRLAAAVAPVLEALTRLRSDTPAPKAPPAPPPEPEPPAAEGASSGPPEGAAPTPAAPALDELMDRMAAANPGLGEWQIKAEVNDQGRLVSLDITSTALRTIAPLAGLRELTRLACRGGDPDKRFGDQVAAPLRDLGPLTNMALTELDICSTSVKDLSVLKGMPLTRLDISRTQVEDLAPLKGMPLVSLACEGTPAREFSCLAGMPLKELRAGGTELRDLAPLKGAPLQSLEIRRTKVRDLAPLAGMPLRLLDITETLVKSLDDLKGMPLDVLRMERTEIRDLGPLEGMWLKELQASQTGIKDLQSLRGMPLQYLMLNQVEIKDLAPLEGMPLRALGLNGTKVRDLAPLQGASSLRELHIRGLELKTLEPIRGLPIEILFVDNPELHRKVLQDMPALKKLNIW